ncbi:MAG TPA: hemerythrin domain-containing protein [Bacteroidia bacterium]|nr:hemerythrin domain-containing protein [Bacteroidia bacterium]
MEQYIAGYESMTAHELSRYLTKEFHTKIRQAFGAALTQLGASLHIEKVNGEAKAIYGLVKGLCAFFTEHAGKEERLLFPLVADTGQSYKASATTYETESFVDDLKEEHYALGEGFMNLRRLTNNYNCNTSASPSRKLAFGHLNGIEQNIKQDIFIEEEYLFPRILRIK